MAVILNLDNAALNSASPKSMVPFKEQEGKVRVLYDSYTWDGVDTVSTAVINVGAPLASGSIIIGARMLHTGTFGATIKLGRTGDDDAYFAAASDPDSLLEANVLDKVSAESQVFITPSGAGTPADGDVTEVAILYISANS